MTPRIVAALFVETNGAYFGLPGVDPWDVTRDARQYAGTDPVVAHPPCQRWGRYWSGGPMLAGTARAKKLGDDDGCFAAALATVRRCGGVIEHPEASHAWRVHGIAAPPRKGGWVPAGDLQGWTCCVEQGAYGHRARKATWLYAVRTALPELRWGRAPGNNFIRLEAGFHSKEERELIRRPPKGMTPEQRAFRVGWLAKRAAEGGGEWCCPERMNKRERAATPIEFRDLLLALARSVTA